MPSTTKPSLPSPGSEKVRPTSGTPATTASAAQPLTKPTAAPGESGRAAAAPVNAIAKGTPEASPTTAAAATSPASGSGSARAIAARPPTTRLAATQRPASGRRRGRPPTTRGNKPGPGAVDALDERRAAARPDVVAARDEREAGAEADERASEEAERRLGGRERDRVPERDDREPDERRVARAEAIGGAAARDLHRQVHGELHCREEADR